MIVRTTVLAAGLAGALAAAQFPAYSQQYMQRLDGAVDALAQVVADFDTSARALGLSREAALGQMTGTPFVIARRQDMQRTFDRFAQLEQDLAELQAYGPFMRAYHARRLSDGDIARAAWQNFELSLPLTLAAGIFAAFGFLVTTTGLRIFVRVLKMPLRRVRILPA